MFIFIPERMIAREYQQEFFRLPCPSCNGQRFIGEYLCGECSGDGSVVERVYTRSASRTGAIGFLMLVVSLMSLVSLVLKP